MKGLNKLSQDIHAANKAKGFYDEEKNIGEMLALIHSEVSEMLEAHRKGQTVGHVSWVEQVLRRKNDETFNKKFKEFVKDTFEDELADTVIRCLDLAGYLNIDIEKHIQAKLRYNSLRPHKHGKAY